MEKTYIPPHNFFLITPRPPHQCTLKVRRFFPNNSISSSFFFLFIFFLRLLPSPSIFFFFFSLTFHLLLLLLPHLPSFSSLTFHLLLLAMERGGGTMFCKFCGLECIKSRSRSTKNPGREYYCCPTPMGNGGHGWVDWVVNDISPTNRFHGNMGLEYGEFPRTQMSLVDAKVALLEDTLRLERAKLLRLKEELKEEKWNTMCLTKVLKGSVVMWVILAFFFVVS